MMRSKTVGLPLLAASVMAAGALVLARERPPLPKITQPVLFDTPEADAILAAMQVFPPDNPWNQDISKMPVHKDSALIIASVGADRDGRSHNVNADEAAGAIARAMGAYKVMFLTDVAGWLRDPADPTSVISEAGADQVEEALSSMQGGMRPKLQACIEAIHGGVTYAHIIDGRLPHSLLLELFTDAGIGTKVRPAT